MRFSAKSPGENGLMEQYPVTAHVLNFDYVAGCSEFKRCEKSKRTLKNAFESCLVEFNTTLKLLRIKFQFGRNPEILVLLSLLLVEDQEKQSSLMLVEGLHVFLPPASLKAQIIMKGISKNRTATIKIM